jgi:predicted nucleic acid-binding protein
VIVADASWIIALRDPRDPHHESAITLNDATIDEVIVLHPLTFAECLVAAARLGQLDMAADAIRAAFEIVDIDIDAPLRWANLRAATSLRLPDAIVLDTAIVHAASMILTYDQQLAEEAKTRAIASPARDEA